MSCGNRTNGHFIQAPAFFSFTLKLTHHLNSLPLATSSRLVQKTFFSFTFITYTFFSPF
jgi:hypothetical protein